MKKFLVSLVVLLCVGLAYLVAWPVPIEPAVWSPSVDPGYTGDFAQNERLSSATYLDLPDGEYGPEDIALGPDGRLYTAVHSGKILRFDLDTGEFDTFASTGGRPLGIEFANDGTLWVADAYIGLLSIDRDGVISERATATTSGSPILYADDVDIAADGRVYFSDASTRFGAKAIGGTLAASLVDLMEHSSNGRVLVYDPATDETDVFAEDLTFANGVAVSADSRSLFVNETGTYAVHRYSLAGDSYGRKTTVLSGLPGFPDNINRMPDGSLWLGIVSPRSPAMDSLAGSPFLRKLVMRLPASARPGPQAYGFVLKIDDDGSVLDNLQDPSGNYSSTTGAIQLDDGRLVVSSLTEPRIAIISP
ncbi:MAG: SMP-30/gluconolactonase/LRE family protein [Congregibacter sp.]